MSYFFVTQAGIEVLSENYSDHTITQVGLEVLSENYSDHTITQVGLEVLSSSIAPPNIPDLESMKFLPGSGETYLLCEYYAGGTILRSSNAYGVALKHWWEPAISNLSSISNIIDKPYGGAVRLNFGSIELLTSLFSNAGVAIPRFGKIRIFFADYTEENAELVFEGTGHVNNFDKNVVRIDLFDRIQSNVLLEEKYIIDPDAIDIVRAGIYKWVLSSSGDYEYYLLLDDDSDPVITLPLRVLENGIEIEQGTAGIMTQSQWAYADNDSLGFNTIYIRMYNDGDPGDRTDGFIRLDYTDKTEPMPAAFGIVEFREPKQATNLFGRTTYYTSGLDISNLNYGFDITEISIDAAAKTVKFTSFACYFADGTRIRILGTKNYDGVYSVVGNCTGYAVVKALYIEEEILEGSVCKIFLESDFIVCEDGVPINDVVINNKNGTFSLPSGVTGNITITGKGDYGTLEEILRYCFCDRMGMSLHSLEYASRMADIQVSCWIDSQIQTIDFASQICQAFSFLFYREYDRAWIIDMFADYGGRFLTDSDITEITYSFQPPMSQLYSSIERRKSGTVSGERTVISNSVNIPRMTDQMFSNPQEVKIGEFTNDTGLTVQALDDIIFTLSCVNVTVKMPLINADNIPKPGEKISFSDDLLNISGFFKVREIQPDFTSKIITVTGEITSARLVVYQFGIETVTRISPDMQIYQFGNEIIERVNPDMQLYQFGVEVII